MAVNREKILREAEKLVQRGRVEQAIKEYEKLIEANPKDVNTLNRVGDLYGRVGQVDRAVELYERISDHFTQEGFTTKAIAILKKINRLAPKRIDIFVRLAELYVQQGLLVEAKSQYQMLAEWFTRNGDHQQAIEAHKKLVQLDPSNHMAHLRLADMLLQVGQAAEALEAYGRLGKMLLQRDKLDEAERLYRHALEQNPPSGEFLIPLLSALLDAGRGTAAREFLDAALQRSPQSTELLVIEVRTQLLLGDARKALDQARKLLEADPDNNEIRGLVGRALLSSGEAVEARDLLLPAAERQLARGDYRGVQQQLQGLLKAMPQDQQVLRLALRAFEPSGDREMLFTLRAALADSCFRSGQQDVARRLYMELVRVEPDNSVFRQRLAQLEGVAPAAVGPGEPARPVAEEEPEIIEFEVPEVDLGPGVEEKTYGELDVPAEVSARVPFDPQERLTEANVFAKYGLAEKAIHHLEDIVRYCPEHVMARAKLVQLYLEQGQGSLARDVAGPLLDHYQGIGNIAAAEALRASLPAAAAAAAPTFGEGVGVEVEEEPVVVIDLEGEEFGLPAAAEPTFELGGPTAEPTFELGGPTAEAPPDLEDIRFEIKELPTSDEMFDEEPGGGGPTYAGLEPELIEVGPVEPDPGPIADAFELMPAETEQAEPAPEVIQVDLEAIPAPLGLAPPPAAAPPPAVEVQPLDVRRPSPPPRVEEKPPTPHVSRPAPPQPISQLADLERELLGKPPVTPPPPAARRPSAAAADLVDALLRETPATPSLPAAPLAAREPAMTEAPGATPSAPPAAAAPPPAVAAPPRGLPEPVQPVVPPAPAEIDAVARAGRIETLGEELVEIPSSFTGPAVSDLKQIDFFIEQELYEDAMRLLDRVQREYPEDPEVAERRLVLKSKGVLLEEVPVGAEGPEELFADEEGYFDLAKELEEELAREEAMVEEATGRGKDEAALEEVFREFQKGVAEQLSEEDSDTHFNLGIAYKEMGLLPEAIREFQVSSRDTKFFVESCSMIGVCYVEQGMADQAAQWYRKALEAPGSKPEEQLALRFELASALEMAGDTVQALDLFEAVAAVDPTYRDVGDRVVTLAQQRQVN